MTNVIDLSKRAKVEDDASLWIAMIDRGLSDNETQEFQNWLTQSSMHYEIFMQFAEFWDFTNRFSIAEMLKPTEASKSESEPIPTQTRTSLNKYFALAASVVCVFSVLLFSSMKLGLGSEEVLYSEDLIAGSEHILTLLPDGTAFTLNAKSKARVVYTQATRKVTLQYGEMYVDVAHDQDRPFIVTSGDYYFRAVGTMFSVSTTKRNTVELLVEEGVVAYGLHNETDAEKDETHLASLGTSVTAMSNSFSVERLSKAEIADKMGWRSGVLKFRGEKLSDVVETMQRYAEKKIVILSSKLASEPVYGRFKSNDVYAFLEMLENNLDISWYENEETIFLTERT